MTNGIALLRIGELARRVGVRPETLRAWERRYGLIEPERTATGYRLYSAADERRVRAMTALLARGVSAAEAAKLARESPQLAERTGQGEAQVGRSAPSPEAATVAGPAAPRQAGAGAQAPAPAELPVIAQKRERLLEALIGFDDDAAQRLLDEAFGALAFEAVIEQLVLPVLAELGERWQRGELSIAAEHFSSELLRARLLGLARGWGTGSGPLALLACPPGERHDIPLICFGIALRARGWRIAFLGADTPVATLSDTAGELAPELVVVPAADPGRYEGSLRGLRELAEHHALVLAGAGANTEVARALGAARLDGTPVEAARVLDAELSAAPVPA